MPFSEYETFPLRQALDDGVVPKGSIGVVLMILDSSSGVYEVEFVRPDGTNLGDITYTLNGDLMARVDEPHA